MYFCYEMNHPPAFLRIISRHQLYTTKTESKIRIRAIKKKHDRCNFWDGGN